MYNLSLSKYWYIYIRLLKSICLLECFEAFGVLLLNFDYLCCSVLCCKYVKVV